MAIKGLLTLALLLWVGNTLTYSMEFTPNERICFYEVFQLNQKYSYVLYTSERATHEVEVSHIDGRQWKSIFYKKTENEFRTRVDKLASTATTYSFCAKNSESRPVTFRIEFNSGLEVMELHELPDANDAENLERELNWLEQQTNTLTERSSNIQGLRSINMQITNMVGTKLLVMGVVGVVGIAAVNFIFFRSLKKTFKERKLI